MPTSPPNSYRSLLADAEFFGLYSSFTLTTAATTISGFALGTLVHGATGSPLLTALAMYGSTFATVIGALTVMSVADGSRPRRTLLLLQLASLAGVSIQAIGGVPLWARFAVLLALGFVQSLNTGTRLGLLGTVVPVEQYALARSLMNITSGGMSILGLAIGAGIVATLGTSGAFLVSAVVTAVATIGVAVFVREHRVAIPRRPGLRLTWETNRRLFAVPVQRRLLIALWVPNGLIVGCEGLLIPYDARHAGLILACGSAGMLLGDLTVGRLLTAAQRRRAAFALRILLAAPVTVFFVHPPLWVACAALFVASIGFGATLLLQERLLELTPTAMRGQVQGVESAGRIGWQGIGAVISGSLALVVAPAVAIGVLAIASLSVTILVRSVDEPPAADAFTVSRETPPRRHPERPSARHRDRVRPRSRP